jgi:uncharacterized protein DUF1638
MGQGIDIIACKIFEHEVKAVVSENEDLRFHWIDAALHADPDKMEQAISETISNLRVADNKIRLLFGSGCHPDMCAIAEKCGQTGLVDEKNCIQAFLGVEETNEIEKDKTMIISPGWLEAWQGIMERFGWDEVDVRVNMGRYDRIVLLDPGLVPVKDEVLLEFYDLVQVPVETMEISLDYFKTFVMKR